MPAELRLDVYKQILPPVRGSCEDFSAMFLGSKQLKAEFEAEACRELTVILETVEKEWDKEYPSPLRIRKPSSISDLQKVVVGVPNSVFRNDDITSFPEVLVPLLKLHLNCLRLEWYEDEEKPSRPVEYSDINNVVIDLGDSLKHDKFEHDNKDTTTVWARKIECFFGQIHGPIPMWALTWVVIDTTDWNWGCMLDRPNGNVLGIFYERQSKKDEASRKAH